MPRRIPPSTSSEPGWYAKIAGEPFTVATTAASPFGTPNEIDLLPDATVTTPV